MSISVTFFERQIAFDNVSPSAKPSRSPALFVSLPAGADPDITDAWHRLLCESGERPSDSRAADEHNEFAPSHNGSPRLTFLATCIIVAFGRHVRTGSSLTFTRCRRQVRYYSDR